jgi:Ni2+-binding GTPase involved in maturation of urease and hydrogenase
MFLDVEMMITENIEQMQTAFFDLEMLITENIAQMCTPSSTQIF